MKEVFFNRLVLLILLLFLGQVSIAQVTIGSAEKPARAAVLDIRERVPVDPSTDNSDSDKGLGLPRVELQSLTSLEPFLDASASAEELMLHQGLMVYNLTNRPNDGLEPAVYIWDGSSFWVKNDQIDPFDFALHFSLDGADFNDAEIVFSSGLSSTALSPKQLTINWKPNREACNLTWVSEESDKIGWHTPPPLTTGVGGSFVLNLDPKPFTQAELDKSPFLEKTTTLVVKIRNAQGDELSKNIKIRQIHHGINMKGMKDGMYMTLGKEYKINIASNLDWTMTSTGNVSIVQTNTIPASSAANEVGENYTFKLFATAANEGQEVTLTFTAPNGELPPIPITLRATKEYANSYMGTPQSSILVPIRQAYIAWKNELDVDLSQENGRMSVELVWQDEPSLVNSLAFVNDGKIGLDRTIDVRTNTDAARQGNALVAFKIDNEIAWSWHVWVSTYVPNNQPAAPGVVNVPGGKVYHRNNPSRNYILMDRDLGALIGTPASTTNRDLNIPMMGYLYQWGRKDPLPPVRDFSTTKARLLYSISNQLLNPGTSDQGLAAEDVPTDIKYNVTNAIKKPMTFYKGSPANDNDWCSAEVDVVNSNAWLEKDGSKAIYDPCPLGWRVPESTYSPSTLTYGITRNTGAAECVDFTADFYGYMINNGTIGADGVYKIQVTNELRGITLWYADRSSDFLSSAMGAHYNTNNNVVTIIALWSLAVRSAGFSVRCVRVN